MPCCTVCKVPSSSSVLAPPVPSLGYSDIIALDASHFAHSNCTLSATMPTHRLPLSRSCLVLQRSPLCTRPVSLAYAKRSAARQPNSGNLR